MKKIKQALFVMAFLVVSAIAFAAANGWWAVSDSCGGVFYLQVDQYESIAHIVAAADRYSSIRCR